MQTVTLCKTPTTALELLREAIDNAIEFAPEIQTGESKTWEDTWLGRFGNDFSGVIFVYQSIKNSAYTGPKFTPEQITHLDSEFRKINQVINVQKQFCRTRKTGKLNNKPAQAYLDLINQLRNVTTFEP